MAATTTTTTTAPMIGAAGIINGQLQLSQGITRTLSSSTAGNFTTIPMIDLAALSSSATSAAKLKLQNDIYDACSRVGFFVIKNHGIEWRIVEKAFAGIKEFFDLPIEKKMAVHQSKSLSYQGYEEVYYTNVDRLKRGDLKESFTTGYDPFTDPIGAGDAMPEILRRHNLWPSEEDAPNVKIALEAYRAACLNLMRKLTSVIAVAIGQKEDFFAKKATYPIAGIRALYYPPQEKDGDEEVGLGAHTDVQLMTMIAQAPWDIQALEVLNANGEWISPKLEPETFIVNLSDMMARLTNDTFQATVHRVCNKDPRGRYSLPFFYGLNNDELAETLPQFVTEDNPLRYERGMTGYEHYNMRMQRAHHKHPSAVNKVSLGLPLGMTRKDGMTIEGV